MEGVPEADEETVGGYVPVNANNHNGSALTHGIPAQRDRDVNPLAADDPDLVKITLSVLAANMPGARGHLSVTHGGRARVKVWDTRRKTNEIRLPATWPAAQVPQTLYVEGVLEGITERDTSLTLACLDAEGREMHSDTVKITVTPLLLDLKVDVTLSGSVGPALQRYVDPALGIEFYVLDCAGLPPDHAFTLFTKVLRTNLRGTLKLVNLGAPLNWLEGHEGVGGAKIRPGGAVKSWDFADRPGKYHVDSWAADTIPFFTNNPQTQPTAEVYTLTDIDTPAMYILDGPNPPGKFNDMAPAANNEEMEVSVVYQFTLYAVWQFIDESIYFLGQLNWGVNFEGTVIAPNHPLLGFNPGPSNRNVGNSDFTVSNLETISSLRS